MLEAGWFHGSLGAMTGIWSLPTMVPMDFFAEDAQKRDVFSMKCVRLCKTVS